jgi:hypothetical protein
MTGAPDSASSVAAMPIAEPRKRTAPILERVTFKTSRLAEFCGEKELTAQTGHTEDASLREHRPITALYRCDSCCLPL